MSELLSLTPLSPSAESDSRPNPSIAGEVRGSSSPPGRVATVTRGLSTIYQRGNVYFGCEKCTGLAPQDADAKLPGGG